MGGITSILGGPKVPGPSAAEIQARKDQEKRLKEQEKAAQLEADRSRQLRISGAVAARNRTIGRGSLIKTGSELGTSETLG